MKQLKNQWFELVLKHSFKESLAEEFWLEIKKKYTEKNRFYHNLSHIGTLLRQAEIHKGEIINFNNFLFAIWYHDIIYKSTKNDNEEKSAVLAKKQLETLNVDEKSIDFIQKLIISTKNHQILITKDKDNAYFLDMDLSILGTDWDTYHKYLKNIRKEYAIFPNFMYKKGRKKILKHFLERDTLYFTEYFQTKFEAQARENLKKEIELLQ